MKATLAAAFAASLLLAPSSGFAQTGTPDRFVTVQPADKWLASQFIGQAVSNEAGEAIGTSTTCCSTRAARSPMW